MVTESKSYINGIFLVFVCLMIIIGGASILGHSISYQYENTTGIIENCCDLNTSIRLDGCDSKTGSDYTLYGSSIHSSMALLNSSGDSVSYTDIVSFYRNDTSSRQPTDLINITAGMGDTTNLTDGDDSTITDATVLKTSLQDTHLFYNPVNCNSTTCPIYYNIKSSGNITVACCNATDCGVLTYLKTGSDANQDIEIPGVCQYDADELGVLKRVDFIINMTIGDSINETTATYMHIASNGDDVYMCSINASSESLEYTATYQCLFEEQALSGYLIALGILGIIIAIIYVVSKVKMIQSK